MTTYHDTIQIYHDQDIHTQASKNKQPTEKGEKISPYCHTTLNPTFTILNKQQKDFKQFPPCYKSRQETIKEPRDTFPDGDLFISNNKDGRRTVLMMTAV